MTYLSKERLKAIELAEREASEDSKVSAKDNYGVGVTYIDFAQHIDLSLFNF